MKKKLILSLIIATTIITGNIGSINAFADDKNNTNTSAEAVQAQKEDKNEAEIDIKNMSVEDYSKSLAEQILNISGATGLQYAVMQDGDVILSDNVGVYSKNNNKKIDSDTMFGIGSVSKMFVAASVMQLVDEGKVDLDKPVINYVPEFKMKDERYKKITVRMLLNHSSGFMGTEYSNCFLYDDNDECGYENLLDELKNQNLKSEPGEYSVYCNDGFTLAQLLVEKVSGDDFTTYIHDNFTEKLKMDQTKTPYDDFDKEDLCKVYDADNNELPQDCISIVGTGGIYSTAEDLCKFMQGLNDNDILSEKSREAMRENESAKGMGPKDSEGPFVFGLGWDNVKSFELNRYNIQGTVKGGDSFQYHSSIIDIPESKMSIAVVSSGGLSGNDELLEEGIAKKILMDQGVIKEILPDAALEKCEKATMDPKLKEYSGYYLVHGAHAYVDIKDGGTLEVTIPGYESQKQIYHYTTDGYFTNENNTGKCKVVKESNGKVYLRIKMYSGITGVAASPLDCYQMQKVEENNNLSSSVKQAWDERKKVDYLIVNERYSSQLYNQTGIPVYNIGYNEKTNGYASSLKIIDENNAINILEIPAYYGRDMSDMNFFKKDDKEYMKKGSYLYVNSKNVDTLTSNLNDVKIDKDGYAKWFKISDLKENTLKVDITKNGGFTVYDKNKKCIKNSVISKDNTVNLKDACYISFAGDKGAEFKLTFSN